MQTKMNFTTPLSEVPRVGPVYQKRLQILGITTVRDLLFHFPRSYEDLSVITPIKTIQEGNTYCASGKLLDLKQKTTFKKRFSVTEALLQDSTGAIKVVWFQQPYLADSLKAGDHICVAGKVLRDKDGIYFASPVHEKVQDANSSSWQFTHVGRIIPTYAETAGVSSRWLRSIIKMVLASLKDIKDSLPEDLVKAKKLPALSQALWQVHFPDSMNAAKLAQKRFAFEELLFISLFVLSERRKIASVKAPPIPLSTELMKRFTDKLPFTLTPAQKKSAWNILKDLENPRPMNRMLQGDVGSGKTVVATMAALSVVKAGYQVACMAPTEILVQQHFKTMGPLLAPFKVTIGLLTGKTDRFSSPKLPNDFIEISRAKLLEKTREGHIDILIGTHALIQDKVKFGNLALVILDEQHRFGVKQRAKLLHRTALIPHLLSMSATPIPRTLAMTIYGDLDLSLIDELPKGRKKIITKIVAPQERAQTYGVIKKEVEKGKQVFVICPRIEKTENSPEGTEVKAVKEEYEKLSKEIFPKLKVGMLHGKMAQKEKEEVMRKFKFKKIDVLVSTSVVEVGVDIPNATVMMIEGADRFGLAQLHQFRGRVGRSDVQSYCFLFSESNSHGTNQRLRALLELDSGFLLAERDLKLRGPGDFAGTKQWGIPDFAMEQLTNLALVQEARNTAQEILEKDIALKQYPLLRARVQELREKLHLE
ncbi:MAG: ATP-dependent DNA helicase RecG [bacterium]|nr:ATP-dependent DNA helicase RecG [bacterium]